MSSGIPLRCAHRFVVLRLGLCLGLGLMGAACGDDSPGDGVRADASVPGGPDAGPGSTAFIVSGDFMGTGIASTIDVPSLRVTQNVIAGVASDDPTVRHIDGKHYIINRFNHDNIVIIDAASRALLGQISTGPGSNPQDVAVQGARIYVAALAAPGVLVLDADDPAAGVIETIDLSALDPGDGVPDCKSVYLAGDTLFVACAILSNFDPSGPGKVAVIDTSDNSVVDVLELSTLNPVGRLHPTSATGPLGGDLLVATVVFGGELTTGCVERIGVTPAPEAKGCLIDNAALGGYATGYTYGADDVLYLSVTRGYDAGGAIAEVRTYDAVAERLSDTAITSAGQRVFDLAQCPTGEWVFADASGGIRVYAASGDELTGDLLDVGLPPVEGGLVCF